jgi:hypothetical protein
MKKLIIGNSGTEFILVSGVTPREWNKRNEIETFNRVALSVKWYIQSTTDGTCYPVGIDFKDLQLLLKEAEKISESPVTREEFNDYHD